jgi:hypothetical protein
MLFPCCAHAIPLPCHTTKGLDCVFPIWFTQCSQVWSTYAMLRPCHATTMPFWKRLLKAMAQRGMGMAWQAWISIGHPESACGQPVRVRLLTATMRSSMKVVSEAYQSINLLDEQFRYFRLPRGLHEGHGTVKKSQGHGMAWHVWTNAAQHGRGTAWV